MKPFSNKKTDTKKQTTQIRKVKMNTITISGIENYNLQFINGSLIITPKEQQKKHQKRKEEDQQSYYEQSSNKHQKRQSLEEEDQQSYYEEQQEMLYREEEDQQSNYDEEQEEKLYWNEEQPDDKEEEHNEEDEEEEYKKLKEYNEYDLQDESIKNKLELKVRKFFETEIVSINVLMCKINGREIDFNGKKPNCIDILRQLYDMLNKYFIKYNSIFKVIDGKDKTNGKEYLPKHNLTICVMRNTEDIIGEIIYLSKLMKYKLKLCIQFKETQEIKTLKI